MTTRRPPERTCVGCRARRPQGLLLRVAVTGDGRIVVSRTAPGRGAWLCDPPHRCLPVALKRKAFDRAFRRPVETKSILAWQQQLAAGHTDQADAAADGGDQADENPTGEQAGK